MNFRFFAGAMCCECARLLAIVAVAVAVPASANVVKCIDADGNITYQDIPCDPGQAGRDITLPQAETVEDSAPWEAAAREARVVRGMPKRWVLRARGAPLEIRRGAAREDATEVWRYVGRDHATLIGFGGETVAWIREEAPRKGDLPPAAAAAPLADPGARGAHNRRFVIAGRHCEHVFAEIGPPDRQEPLNAPAPAATKNYYEPQAGDPQMRTAFTCIGGKVVDVERTVVR